MFDIQMLPLEFIGEEGHRGLEGRITLGDYWESFVSPLDFWTRADYEAQWQQGVELALHSGRPSCLIVSIERPSESELVRWWLLYPEGERVYVQEHLLILPDLSISFSLEDPYSFIPDRKQLGEEGAQVSEWEVSRTNLQDFLERFNRPRSSGQSTP